MAYITGFHAIEEHLLSGGEPRASRPVDVTGTVGPLLSAKPGPRARELVSLALSRGVRVDRVGTAELDRRAPGHRGLALEVSGGRGGVSAPAEAAGRPAAVEEFLAGLGGRPDALVMILDEITDPHNYGAILRSCDQFGADLVISRRRRNAKNAPVIARTSAGASAWVPNVEEGNLVRAVQLLRENGFWIYGADMNGTRVWELDLSGRTAIVMGGEAGLSRLLKERCDGIAAIPCSGRIDSLNVSVAAGILLYEARRQRAIK